jgi:hypothetical protein
MRSTLHRSAPAIGLAAAVVVLSAGSGAVAAGMITGAQIKNGTVTTHDVKNHTLRRADLSSGVAKGLKGTTHAFAASNTSDTAMSSTAVTLLSRQLPPGSYVVVAKGWVFTAGDAQTTTNVDCDLNGPATDHTAAYIPAHEVSETFGLMMTFRSSAASTIVLTCSGTPDALVTEKQMIAIRVDDLSSS